VHSFILKPKHAIAAHFQPSRAGRIILNLIWFGMGIAVNLNHQLGLGAIKIRNEMTDGMLPPNFVTKLLITHPRPHFGFHWRERVAHITRTLRDEWANA
jgi:hypothetical protein